MKICPFCGEQIQDAAQECRYCGEWLNKPTPSSPNLDAITLIRQALGSQYDVEGVIGKGGMATVYKARQKSLGRDVAIKVIHQNLVHDNEFVERFLREAQIGASLNHPNIITVYDVGSIDTVHYMVMEYLEGMDLLAKVRQEAPLAIEEVVELLSPIANALGYIHGREFIHRDIKTSNIFITKSGRPVLMDFGIARSAEGTKLTRAGTIIGTAEYMSPEQAEGNAVDSRSDLYSLGVVMYECLSGRVPFKSDNPLTTIHQVLNNALPDIRTLNGDVPVWMAELLGQLLSKDPDLRPGDGYAVAMLMKQEVTPKANNGKQPAKRKSGGKVFGWIMLVFLLVSIGVLGYNYIKEQRRQEYLREQRQIELAQEAEKQKQTERITAMFRDNMVYVQGGTFLMGCTNEQSNCESDETPVHRVTLDDYYIGITEVTQEQWEFIMRNNPSRFKGAKRPVDNVSWYDVQTFIQKLNNLTRGDFRLPTEAEWEFAARGGRQSRGYIYSGSNTLSNVAWYKYNSLNKTHNVGSKASNELGLYDMSGNVWEWCSDRYGTYSSHDQRNPSGPSSRYFRVCRGGSRGDFARSCRVAFRSRNSPGRPHYILGVRLASSSKY